MNPCAHNDISSRIDKTRKMLKSCSLCPRNCSVNRLNGQTGYCKLDDKAYCFREMLGFNEENELTPSHQIYFAGCNLSCEFCAVAEWNSGPDFINKMDVATLAHTITKRKEEGSITLNLLGGEPSVSLLGILQLLAKINSDVRVVWNSNMYFNPSVQDTLKGLVDIYLADLKCGNNKCAVTLLDAPDYLSVIRKNIREVGTASDLIIRHLILPGHYECCFEPSMRWIAAELPDAKVSLRGNYVPPANPKFSPECYLGAEVFQEANDFARSLGLNVIT